MTRPVVRSAALALLAAAVVFAVMLPFAPPLHTTLNSTLTSSAAVGIVDDDNGHPLFPPGSPLAPGEQRTACFQVAVSNADSLDTVAFFAGGVTGGLAPYLSLHVEQGQGAAYGNCSGFTGASLWSGTLADLVDATRTGGVDTGWNARAEPQRSFRITATVLDAQAAAGQQVSGDFGWQLFGRRAEPSPSPSSPSPSSASPSDSPSESPSDSPTDPEPTDVGPGPHPRPHPSPSGSSSPEVQPTGAPSPTTSSSSPTPPPGGSPSASRSSSTRSTAAAGTDDKGSRRPPATRRAVLTSAPDVIIGHPAGSARELARKLSAAAAAVAGSPQYPLFALMLALAFLILQSRLDRRDPKLAAAAVTRRDAEVGYDDPFGEDDR